MKLHINEDVSNTAYVKYSGKPTDIMGRKVYVKFPTGYVSGEVIEYIPPRRGIVGTYKVRRDDGKTMSATTLYINDSVINEDVSDTDSLFNQKKKQIINFLNNSTAKSIKIFRLDEYSYETVTDVVKMLKEDDEILQAIIDAGVTAKLKFRTNRYGQASSEVTFIITNTNPRNPGWSSWV